MARTIYYTEIKKARKDIRSKLPSSNTSLMTAICDHKHSVDINHEKAIHCLICGYNGDPEQLPPLPTDVKQPVFLIHEDYAEAIIKEAGNKYDGYELGETTSYQLLDQLTLLPRHWETFITMADITRMIKGFETNKMPGGANRSLDNIFRAINARKTPSKREF